MTNPPNADQVVQEIEEALAGRTETCNGVTMTFSTPDERLRELLQSALSLIPRWVSSKEQLPPEHTLVLVEGGVANIQEGVWYSQTGGSFNRPIQWEVKYWAEIPTPPEDGDER